MRPIVWLRLIFATMLAMGVFCPPQALAQMPARFYLKSLSDGNAVPVIFNSISGNTNPFDPAHTVTPGAQFDASMALAGYAHTFELFDRAAMAAVILEMGRISGDVTVAGRSVNQSAGGVRRSQSLTGPARRGSRAWRSTMTTGRREPGE